MQTQDQLVSQAKQIAAVLQQLGYFGRYSFDSELCRGRQSRDIVHWIECNGRCGGVSIPMSLARSLSRVLPNGSLIVQETLQGICLSARQIMTRLYDLLFQRGAREDGLLLLSPALSDAGTSVNMLVLAGTQEDAEDLVAKAMARVLPGK